ncbi:MAG: CBS domain-containing protein [Phycisphaeraceae bacterium]|nr:CBS domain-containing protein [Phycisphaeraceae bacterium]
MTTRSTVRQLLSHKDPNIHTVPQTASVAEAINKMNSHRIGALLVMEPSGRLTGIITERDILRNIVGCEQALDQTPVSRWMTRKVVCCTTDTCLEDAKSLMARHHVRHLPVMDRQEQCMGLISIQDVTAYQAHDRQLVIRHLEDYMFAQRT